MWQAEAEVSSVVDKPGLHSKTLTQRNKQQTWTSNRDRGLAHPGVFISTDVFWERPPVQAGFSCLCCNYLMHLMHLLQIVFYTYILDYRNDKGNGLYLHQLSPPLTHHCFHCLPMVPWAYGIHCFSYLHHPLCVWQPMTLHLSFLPVPQSGLPPTPLMTDAKTISAGMSLRTWGFP